MEIVTDFIFLDSKITADGDCSHEIKDACFLEEKLWRFRQHIKKQRHYFADKCLSSQSYGFSSSRVSVWEFDRKESWALKNWCFWAVVLESPLDYKEIKPVSPKGNLFWISTGRTDAKDEAPIIWSPDWKNRLTGKDSDAGKGRRRRGCPRIRWLDGITNLMDISLWKLGSWWWTRKPGCAAVHRVANSQTSLNDWTKLNPHNHKGNIDSHNAK